MNPVRLHFHLDAGEPGDLILHVQIHVELKFPVRYKWLPLLHGERLEFPFVARLLYIHVLLQVGLGEGFERLIIELVRDIMLPSQGISR